MANSYLTRTPSSGGNRKTFTISSWFKRSKLGDTQILVQAATDGSTRSQITLRSDDMLQFYSENGGVQKINVRTTRVFRDTSAWYHVVVAVDTTQGTASNRVKIYINGVQETSLNITVYGDQDYDTQFNHTVAHTIGRRDAYGDMYFEGYQSHFALVDGTALTSTSFGSTDSTSGIWKFKSPTGITWGTNGVHLKFESSGNLGLDSSGQTNNYTVNGNLKQALDTPSNVYTTLNPLSRNRFSNNGVYSNANTTFSTNDAQNSDKDIGFASMGITTGKFYWEVQVAAADRAIVGVGDAQRMVEFSSVFYDNNPSYSIALNPINGNLNYNNTSTSYGSSLSNDDIVMVALDMTNHRLWFGKNGSWFNSATQTEIENGTATNDVTTKIGSQAIINTGEPMFPFFADISESGRGKWNVNFGNGFFGTTAITSAGSNGNGSLFEYDVPSGYYALNTKNINTYG